MLVRVFWFVLLTHPGCVLLVLMVFVRKVPGRAGPTKVQIAEHRRRDVVLEHVGTAHTDAELAVLMQIARRKTHSSQDELDLGLEDRAEGTAASPAVITGRRSAVLW